MEYLPEIVECRPTLNHHEILYNRPTDLNFRVLKKLIEKRKLSPLCDRELLRTSSTYSHEVLEGCESFTPKHLRNWNEYVTFSHWRLYEYRPYHQRTYVYLRKWVSERKD